MSIETPQPPKAVETEAEVVSQSNKIVIRESGSLIERRTEYHPQGHCAYEKVVERWREAIDDWYPVDGELIENLSISIKDDGSIVIRESGRNRAERKKEFSERECGGYEMEVSVWDAESADWIQSDVRVIKHVDVDVPQYMLGDNR